jgi:hypothetical protein
VLLQAAGFAVLAALSPTAPLDHGDLPRVGPAADDRVLLVAGVVLTVDGLLGLIRRA